MIKIKMVKPIPYGILITALNSTKEKIRITVSISLIIEFVILFFIIFRNQIRFSKYNNITAILISVFISMFKKCL